MIRSTNFRSFSKWIFKKKMKTDRMLRKMIWDCKKIILEMDQNNNEDVNQWYWMATPKNAEENIPENENNEIFESEDSDVETRKYYRGKNRMKYSKQSSVRRKTTKENIITILPAFIGSDKVNPPTTALNAWRFITYFVINEENGNCERNVEEHYPTFIEKCSSSNSNVI